MPSIGPSRRGARFMPSAHISVVSLFFHGGLPMMAFGDRSHEWSKYALEPRDAATARRTCGAGHLGADHPRHGSRPAPAAPRRTGGGAREAPRKSGASSRSEEHTSELQSLMRISYAVFCLKKTNTQYKQTL